MDDPRRQEAIARLKRKREFWTHLFVYVAVNALLVVVWLATDAGGYFWPVWPIAGWGIGVTMHAFDTFRRPIGEAAIQREIARQSKDG